jgi:hypothetical protein
MASVSNQPPSEAHMTELVRTGDPAALGEVFTHYRDRLRRMVVIRMDRRLQGRVDPSDVLQEAHLDAARRSNSSATSRSCARSAAAGWASSTRPSRCRSAGGSP